MSNEIQVRRSLRISNGAMQYTQPCASAYTFDQVLVGGPTPGLVLVTIKGVAVDLSRLTLPGEILLVNLDPTNFVEFGIYSPITLEFYPLGELRPNDPPASFRLSRNVAEQYYGSGTGTSGGGETNQLMLKANGPTGTICKVIADAFEA
jgi:hypothetical protein